jgi:putative phosphoesterase
MRIALLSDLHANLPFAEAAVERARREGCDRIIHLGDALDLGPWPAETLDFLASEQVETVRGNHDEYPVLGLTPAAEKAINAELREHIEWTAAQLSERHIAQLLTMPAQFEALVDEWLVRFSHFALTDGRVSDERLHDSSERISSRLGLQAGQIACFGHTHRKLWDFRGDRALLNPGATGFKGKEQAGFAILAIRDISVWVEWHPVESSMEFVVAELERRQVPAWRDSVRYMFEALPA